jgi:hypothetical protein
LGKAGKITSPNLALQLIPFTLYDGFNNNFFDAFLCILVLVLKIAG